MSKESQNNDSNIFSEVGSSQGEDIRSGWNSRRPRPTLRFSELNAFGA